LRAAIKESGLLPGGMGSEAYSRDSIFSSGSGVSNIFPFHPIERNLR
jgi:hypothetical protein